MKKAFLTIFCICVAAIGVLLVINNISDTRYVAKSEKADYYNSQWTEALADYVNIKGLNISVDGKDQYSIVTAGAFMKDDMTLMISEDAVRAAFDCAIDVYDNERLVIARGSMNTEIFLEDIETVGASGGQTEEQSDTDTEEVLSDREDSEYAEEEPVEYRDDAIIKDGEIYISGDLLTESTGYSYKWDRRSMTAVFSDEKLPETALPEYFNGLDSGRVSSVKNQGNFGACWAFAALSAVESSLLPEEYADFSAEHMMYNSGFGMDPKEGGDYLMAMAYLSGWRGPVYEEDDPYGDEISDPTLEAVKHVQEVQLIEDKDFDTIKHMVFKYGAVECSLHISEDEEGLLDEGFYNRYRKSYCYQGEDGPNHEIVIIGWDDNYPKEYFNIPVNEDGAFICKNSWGESFGAEGIFYVSYEDSVIGTSSEIYTRIEDTDNYDNIYEMDKCGWIGKMGFNRNKAYMAGVFASDKNETLKAVSFYATGPDTSYEIYVCKDYQGVQSLSIDGEILAEGQLSLSGYYTINLDKPVELEKGSKFAVIVMVDTPGSAHPIAVEINMDDERTANVSSAGKESYISSYGKEWEMTQSDSECNVCMKIFTDNR